jgi:Spy/CpxP family protein refolding chaperone
MKKTAFITTLVLGALISFVGCSEDSNVTARGGAAPQGNNRPTRRADFFAFGLPLQGPVLANLQATPELRQKIQALGKEVPVKNKPIHQKIAQNQQALRAAIMTDLDSTTISALYKERQKLFDELEWNRFEAHLKARDLLTPAQRAELKKFRSAAFEAQKKKAGAKQKAM